MGEQVKDERRQRLCSLSSARRGVHRFVLAMCGVVERELIIAELANGKMSCTDRRYGVGQGSMR